MIALFILFQPFRIIRILHRHKILAFFSSVMDIEFALDETCVVEIISQIKLRYQV